MIVVNLFAHPDTDLSVGVDYLVNKFQLSGLKATSYYSPASHIVRFGVSAVGDIYNALKEADGGCDVFVTNSPLLYAPIFSKDNNLKRSYVRFVRDLYKLFDHVNYVFPNCKAASIHLKSWNIPFSNAQDSLKGYDAIADAVINGAAIKQKRKPCTMIYDAVEDYIDLISTEGYE